MTTIAGASDGPVAARRWGRRPRGGTGFSGEVEAWLYRFSGRLAPEWVTRVDWTRPNGELRSRAQALEEAAEAPSEVPDVRFGDVQMRPQANGVGAGAEQQQVLALERAREKRRLGVGAAE